ncbi:MAG: hypothetical protein Q9225_006042, partial [Loekoesia sp. 1 TL-2023]
MSPVHDTHSRNDHVQDGTTGVKRRGHTWSPAQDVDLRFAAAQKMRQASSRKHSSMKNPASTINPQHPETAVGDISEAMEQTVSAVNPRSTIATRPPHSTSSRPACSSTLRSTVISRGNRPQSSLEQRFGSERRSVSRIPAYRFHSTRPVQDGTELKQLLEDTAGLYFRESLTQNRLFDLRDELVSSLHDTVVILQELDSLYSSLNIKKLSRLAGQSDGSFGLEDICSIEAISDPSIFLQLQLGDSRHSILRYARLIDRFHRRRMMFGKMDAIFERIDHLYSTSNPSHNDRIIPGFSLPGSSLNARRSLRSLERFFDDLSYMKTLLDLHSQRLLEGIDELYRSLDILISSEWAQSRLERQNGITHNSESSSKEKPGQMPLPEFSDLIARSQQPEEAEGRPESKVELALSPPETPADVEAANLGHDVSAARLASAHYAKVRPRSWDSSLKQWPYFYKCRRLCFTVMQSLSELIEILKEPMDGKAEHIDMRQFLLYAMELYHWKDEFLGDSYEARRYVRLREEWDIILSDSRPWDGSSALVILNRVRELEENKATLAYHAGRNAVYHGFRELDLCRYLYGPYSAVELNRINRKIFNPWIKSSHEIRLLTHQGFREQDKAVYPLKHFIAGFSSISILSQHLLDRWLQPSGHYIGRPMISKKKMQRCVSKCRVSFMALKNALYFLQEKVLKASQPSKSIISAGSLGQYPVVSTLGLLQDNSPTYLPVEGKEGNSSSSGTSKHSPQTSWPKVPYFQSAAPSADSRTMMYGSRQKLAAFHASATLGRPPAAAAAAALETTDASEQEADQVCRGSEVSKCRAGSPLGYHVPSVKMRESMLASRSSRSAYWQYTLYEGLRGEKVKVHYCRSLETTERISKLFLDESVIGFDIEWKPLATAKDGIRKNVATIQLASEERIALFHVARFSKEDKVEDLVAPSFKRIMESASITKVGVSVKSDCTRLRKFMNIDSRGLFELSHLYKLVRFASHDVKKINKILVSLATQVEEHLMLPMYKDENVRASDWSEELNYEQIY